MTAPTGLGRYEKPQGSQGDRIQAQQMVDRPLLVWVRKLQHLNRTKFSAEGGDAIYLDFIDLQTNNVYIEVMWMAGAIVDGLKQYAGDNNAYPVKVVKVVGGQWGSYQTIESLADDPTWMNHIAANLPAFQQLIAQTRAQKEAEWAQAMQQPPAPPQVPGGPPPAPALAPAGAAPQYQQPGQQAQYGQPAAAPQPQYQQPAAQVAPPQYQQAPAAPPQQPQYAAPPAAAPPAQPGYPPQQPPAQPQYQAPAAYQPPAGPPPMAQAQPPQYQQPAAPPAGVPGPPPAAQYGAPQQPPAGPPGLPTPPGAVTGQTVEQLQQQLNAIGG